ncbi:oligosaccharide flippase family protein [Acinetobacter johnsonii]|uniref:Oligosaccharide flippase family protein n=1 Tax=Acinetobacter johnsonii TaxID=40214 RepID=A0AA42SQJ7_ACIJO|nr:oligosaccharide flippase family protein [Acinetobacter johnsonii]MDH0967791.1 oligosaccharide flippase family protein [Acinetobacter johnsonii]
MKSLLDKVNAKLNAQGGFFKAVSVLVGGTAFAQVIGLICLPILTRIYTPEDYSILGVYIAIVSIFSVISCLRFEIAIPIAKSDFSAKKLLILSIYTNFLISILLFITITLLHSYLVEFAFLAKLENTIYLIPLGVLVAGMYSAFQFWSIRKNNYSDIARSRMMQAISGNSSSILIGYTYQSFLGLMIGQIFNLGGGILKLSLKALQDFKELPKVKRHVLFKTFVEYKNYPKYSTLEALLNTAALQLPIIIIGFFLIGPAVGFLYLAMRILGIPMSLIGSSMGQVYVAQGSKIYERKGDLYNFTIRILKKLFKITLIPFLLLAILSPFLFGFILGEDWGQIGWYISLMVPWYFMHILTSPLSMSLHIVGKQKVALILQGFNLFLRVIVLILVCILNKEIAVFYYLLSGFLFYCIYLFVIVKKVRGD